MAFTTKPGGWFRSGEPEVDSFYLGRDLDDLEERISDAILAVGGEVTGPTTTLGNDFVGDETEALSINHSSVIPVTMPTTGKIKIEVLAAGDGGGVGTLSMRGVVYAGVSSSSAKLGEGTVPGSVTNGDALAWVTVGDEIQVPSGVVYVGYQTGGTNTVATGRKNTGPLGSSYFNSDTYADGAADTFGTPTSDTAIHCIRVTFTEIPPAYITGLTALDEGVPAGDAAAVTEIDFVGDNVSASVVANTLTVTVTGASSSAVGSTVSKTQFANFPFPASGVIESDPIETAAEGTLVVASAFGDQTISSIQVLDSLDATTWRAAYSTSATVFRPYAKVKITNSVTVQGDSEASYSTA